MGRSWFSLDGWLAGPRRVGTRRARRRAATHDHDAGVVASAHLIPQHPGGDHRGRGLDQAGRVLQRPTADDAVGMQDQHRMGRPIVDHILQAPYLHTERAVLRQQRPIRDTRDQPADDAAGEASMPSEARPSSSTKRSDAAAASAPWPRPSARPTSHRVPS
ncbi:hypothetical protein Ddc_18970 [Ditylenchus destructor]|nr:hypothetical protein Ddc_18970 [Ditylenchus destructor]